MCLQVVNSIRDNVRPALERFVKVDIATKEGKDIVIATIQRGDARPYYLHGKGLRPEGVFIRKGPATIPASENEILELIKTTSGNDFESNPCLLQELTFKYSQQFFLQCSKALNETTMKSLGFFDDAQRFTNLAYLFSDQCKCSLKLAYFLTDPASGDEVFQDRLEVTGSVLEQLEKGMAWLDRNNRSGATFGLMQRIDHRDYPPKALRETLINAVVHRDYSFNGPTLVNLYADHLEVISIGGLVKGLNVDDMLLGVSRPRNIHLADVFVKLKLVEGWGTGIRTIEKKYSQNTLKPQFQVSAGAFKVVLPMLDAQRKLDETKSAALTPLETGILDMLHAQPTASRKDLQDKLHAPQSTTIVALKKLQARGLIARIREGKSFSYQAK